MPYPSGRGLHRLKIEQSLVTGKVIAALIKQSKKPPDELYQ